VNGVTVVMGVSGVKGANGVGGAIVGASVNVRGDQNVNAAAGHPSAAVAKAPGVFDANASAPSFSSKPQRTAAHGNHEL